jgi:hypothetical protein
MAGAARPGTTMIRILCVLALLVPTGFLFAGARGPAADREGPATQELLGVAYLHALQPLTAAFLAAEAVSVSGHTVDATALTQAIGGVDAVDNDSGVTLGVHDRWTELRRGIQSLTPRGSPRSQFTAYGDMAALLLALYAHLEQTSGLANDPQGDVASLQRVVTLDLPQVMVAAAGYGDLAQVELGDALSPADLAELATQRAAVEAPGRNLVESMQSAVAHTSSRTLSGNILGELDGMRLAIDAVGGAKDFTGDQLSSSDVAGASALSSHIADAGTALAAKVFDALVELITQRRDGARSDLTRADLALGAAIVLIVGYAAIEAILAARRRGRDPDDGLEPPVLATRREQVGAAR